MYAIFKLYSLLTFLLHLAFVTRCVDTDLIPTTTATNGSYLPVDESINGKDSNAIETPHNIRARRQLYYDQNLFYIPTIGLEGSRCMTGRGIQGLCVRIDQCKQYSRVQRQVAFYSLRQWANPIGAWDTAICSFVDSFGRANSGICCANDIESGNSLSYIPVLIPRPLPVPPLAVTPSNEPSTTPPPIEEGANKSEENESDYNTEVINSAEFNPPTEEKVDNASNFDEENHIEDSDYVPAPVPYDDSRYQWDSQFGSFGAQWPPAAPTHPPAVIGSWPPPIPTHPPNHHYPTHPPNHGDAIPTEPATTLTTKRTPITTTTRRSSYPNYPSYPGYPSYRPTFSPITSTRRTTKAPINTTMRPASTATSANGLPLQCGLKNPTSPDQERIVGGINASPYEFPWIAVLFKSGKQFCGASLITKEHILTAAHCVARMTSWDVAALTAHLGDYNIRTDFEVKHLVRRIKRLVRHKGFDFSTLHNDIAILTLNEPVKFSYEVQPICLPTSPTQIARSYSGQTATVAGWGSLRENGPQPSILQKVEIPIWTNSECARKYGRAAPAGIIESMICAGQSSKDSCSGDSGGPLILNEGGRYTQIGIVSWGIGCGKGQYPGVYTRVTSLLPWIYKNIK